MNEREIRETSECLSFQAFLSVCFSHGMFSPWMQVFSLDNMRKIFFRRKKRTAFYEKLKGDVLKTLLSFQPFFGQLLEKLNDYGRYDKGSKLQFTGFILRCQHRKRP